MAANNTRSMTAPELKIGRKSSPAPTPGPTPGHTAVNQLRNRELALCPSKLIANSTSGTSIAPPKKSAPSAPAGAPPPPPTYKKANPPFSVEGRIRRNTHTSDGVPTGHSNFDIHVVDLDEKGAHLARDNVSDISSIASTSPQRPKHRN